MRDEGAVPGRVDGRPEKMPLWEVAQIGFGLSLPYFLFPYLV